MKAIGYIKHIKSSNVSIGFLHRKSQRNIAVGPRQPGECDMGTYNRDIYIKHTNYNIFRYAIRPDKTNLSAKVSLSEIPSVTFALIVLCAKNIMQTKYSKIAYV